MAPDGTLATVTAVAAGKRNMFKTVFHWMPSFVYVFLLFLGIELLAGDVRGVISIGPYAVSPVEILYSFAFLTSTFELLKVSTPAVDSVNEAIVMALFAGLMVVFLVLGLTTSLHIFRNTEFLVITFMALIQSGFAFKLNSRTLKRSIVDTR